MNQIGQLILLFLVLVGTSSAAKIVCYYRSWAVYEDITPEVLDPDLCTHINYAFLNFDEDGVIYSEDQYLDLDLGLLYRISDLKARNANLKVLFSVGGPNVPAAQFASLAGNITKRTNFVNSARQLIETYNFDGIDIYWDEPGRSDREFFTQLVLELTDGFKPNGWLISAAVGAIPGDGFDIPTISRFLDLINIKIYGLYGGIDYTGPNAALYPSAVESDWEKENLNMEASVNNWLNAGADADKIIAGFAFYGLTFTLQDPNNNTLHAPIIGAGEFAYIDFCRQLDQWECSWDDEQKVPSCLKGNKWISYDDVQSITEKVNFINSKGLGGAMIWSIDQDDINGDCGQQKALLLHAIYDNLI